MIGDTLRKEVDLACSFVGEEMGFDLESCERRIWLIVMLRKEGGSRLESGSGRRRICWLKVM